MTESKFRFIWSVKAIALALEDNYEKAIAAGIQDDVVRTWLTVQANCKTDLERYHLENMLKYHAELTGIKTQVIITDYLLRQRFGRLKLALLFWLLG